MADRIYTPAEKAQRARLLFQGAHRAYGDTSSIDRKLERLDQAAEDRARRENQAYARQLDAAKNEVAAARVAERCAPREKRAAARRARQEAEKRLRAVERARRERPGAAATPTKPSRPPRAPAPASEYRRPTS